MTWVIALPGFPTGAVLLADVRVSFVDPQSGRIVAAVDGVQKVHPVAQNLAVGFAGSVVAGFVLAQDLARWLSGIKQGHVWSPARIANQWQRRLRAAWRELPEEVKAGGCDLLLAGAWPSAHAAFSHSDAYRFTAPDFNLTRLRRGHAAAIGSGAGVPAYKEMLESFADEWHELAQFSIQPFPGGPAGPMSAVLGQLIADNPEATVSTQLVFCLVSGTKTSIYTVTSPRAELTTPPLAASLAEFETLCWDRGLAAAAATGAG